MFVLCVFVHVRVHVTDVPAWLKSLRLHKYAALFSTMTYDEMMSLTEEQLEAQVYTDTHTYTLSRGHNSMCVSVIG